MLDLSRKSADIARSLLDELGEDAFSFVSVRVEEARQASDHRGVRLWSDIGSELLRLGPSASGSARRPNAAWRLMQKIEYYRHRATEVERKAAATPEPYRRDMLELAVQWRDLALHTELAGRAEQRAHEPQG